MPVEAALDEEDWVDVDESWWRLPYTDVSWSYRRQFLWSLEGIRYADHPLPPHYQDTFCHVNGGLKVVENVVAADSELDLNAELVGVRGVEAVMRRYEFDVGIVSASHMPAQASRLHACLVTEEEDISAVQSRWEDQVRMLFGEAFRRSLLDSSYDWEFDQGVWNLDESVDNLSRTSTSPDVVDLTNSELSAESEPPPSTPSVDRKSYAQVVFVEHSGHDYQERRVIAPSPAKALNASALSFIPAIDTSADTPSRASLESPYTSPTYEFHFPSLSANPLCTRIATRSLPANLEKDEQGFYIEVPSPPSTTFSNDSTRTATPKRPSASLLPAFLADASNNARNRHTSKTRVIVDRLRSSATSTTSDPPRRPRKIDISPSRCRVEDSVQIKESEADVFVDPMSNIDGWITSIENEAIAAGPPFYDDGWIESSSKGRRAEKAKSHKRSGSSVSSFAPTTSLSSASSATSSFSSSSTPGSALPNTSSTFHGSQALYPFTAPYTASGYSSNAYPTIAPSQAQAQAYFQMQYRMQLQVQAQWQMQMQVNARLQAGMAQGYPMYQPPVPAPPHSLPVATSIIHTRTKSLPYAEPKRITVPITGVAGIRHA